METKYILIAALTLTLIKQSYGQDSENEKPEDFWSNKVWSTEIETKQKQIEQRTTIVFKPLIFNNASDGAGPTTGQHYLILRQFGTEDYRNLHDAYGNPYSGHQGWRDFKIIGINAVEQPPHLSPTAQGGKNRALAQRQDTVYTKEGVDSLVTEVNKTQEGTDQHLNKIWSTLRTFKAHYLSNLENKNKEIASLENEVKLLERKIGKLNQTIEEKGENEKEIKNRILELEIKTSKTDNSRPTDSASEGDKKPLVTIYTILSLFLIILSIILFNHRKRHP